MGLSFLNTAFLGALSLVSIPIIIHLLQRRRYRVVKWGAMEFLRLSERKRSRRLMIEQLLLLLIRCLIIALVVMAICRPILRSTSGPMASGRGQVHAILILDNSYSMAYRLPGARDETVFDVALRRSLELVQRGLKQGDGVSIVLASEPPKVLIRRASLDLTAVTATLKRVKLSDAGTNYGKAARLALTIANESRFVNREVYVIGDNQKIGWEGKGQDNAAWEGLTKLAKLLVLPLREGAAANAAVEWVQAARGLATAKSSTRIQARIVNMGPQPLRGLTVTLEVDGKPQGSAQRLDVEPGQGSIVAFNQIFDRPGVRACTLRIAPDRLPQDDVGYLALRVRDSVRVQLLNGKPNLGAPEKDGAFFLQMALTPPLAGPGSEPTPMNVRVVTGNSFGSSNVRESDVAILSDVSGLNDADRRLLAEFVQNGGGALLFLGDRVNPTLYNRDLFSSSPSLLPAQVGAIQNRKTSLDPVTLDHPALQRFRGAQDVDVGTAEFSRYYTLTPKQGDKSVQVLARFTNGSPAIVEKQFGLGKVILVASTATTEWNNLPIKPFFLPLIHQLVAYLATGTDGTRNGTVGEPIVKPLPLEEASKTATIADPAGGRTTVKPAVDDRGAIVTIESPAIAGFYRLAVENGTRDTFAVNRNVVESDLKALTEPELRRLLPVREWSWIGINEDLLSALNRTRQGIELWRHLLLTALALMALETMLAQLFGRRS